MSASADNISTSATTLCFLELDLLALVLCASVGPLAWVVLVDPMLEELIVSLVLSRPAGDPTPRCLPTAVAP